MNIDRAIDKFFEPFAELLSSFIFYEIKIFDQDFPLIVLWLIFAGIFFTFYFRFINLFGLKHAIDLVTGKFNSKADGEVSHFQALSTAVSGTVGIGNIGGVAIAISIGGPGATFWLIVAGFLGMTTKFIECTAGVLFRRVHENGSISGGPMHYLEHGFKKHGFKNLGRGLGIFYAAAITIGCLGIGNMFQSNQAFEQFVFLTGYESSFFADKGWLFGLAISGMVAIVILGGIKSIAKVTSTLVPFMAIFYVIACLIIILFNLDELPSAIQSIFREAFSKSSVAGGMIGVMIIGFQRAVFSNEAGLGSSAIAHSAAKVSNPVEEGAVALLEPFIDTIIVCSMTALVIIITGAHTDPSNSQYILNNQGGALTSSAMGSVISWFPNVLSVAVFLFAFSTMISWSYYGERCWVYLFGDKSSIIYKILFLLFTFLGSIITATNILDFSDLMILGMAFPNILGLVLLSGNVKQYLHDYEKSLKSN